MKKYILKFLAFSLLAFLIFGGWAGTLVWLELSAHAREVKMPPGTVYAVCGDSQTELGLKPDLWPHFFNFSKSGIQLDQVELKVVDLLERNPGMLKVLLVDISPRKLAVQSIDRPLAEARSAGKRFLLHLLYPQKNRRPLDGFVILFRDSLMIKRTGKALESLLFGECYTSAIGGPGGSSPDLSEEDVARNRKRLLAKKAKIGFRSHRVLALRHVEDHSAELRKWGPVGKDAKSVGCIKDIVTYVKSHGVVPVLMTTPLHPLFWEKVPKGLFDNFREVMRGIARDCDVAYLDYLEMPFAEEEWRDGNHLNVHGAVRFTECVRADVERLVVAGPTKEGQTAGVGLR